MSFSNQMNYVFLNQRNYLLKDGNVDWDNFNLKLLSSSLSNKKIVVLGFKLVPELIKVEPDIWISISSKL